MRFFHPPATWLALLPATCCVAAGAADMGDTAAAGAPAASAADGQLDTVVITGDKLRRREATTTQSVATRSGRQIDESSATTLEDVVNRMANVSTTYGLTIRGIPLYGPTSGTGKTATITVDGVPQDGFGQDITGLSVWDAAGVEVLRGPQSTNQGRNALAGAVILKTRDPGDAWDLRGRASVTHPNGHNLAVAGGGPLVADVLAFRLSAEDQRDDGDTVNRTRNDRRWDPNDRRTLRGKLRFTPANTDYQALLTLTDDHRTDGDPYVEATLLPASDRIALSNAPSRIRNTARTVAFEQTAHGLGIDWTWLGTWGFYHYDSLIDYDRTELDQGTYANRHGDRQQSQELRGNVDRVLGPGRVHGVFGAYWARQAGNEQRDYVLPVSYVLTAFGVCASRAACDARYPTGSVTRGDQTQPVIRNRAFFAEADYLIGAYTLTAGLRRDTETQTRHITSLTGGDTPAAVQVVGLLHSNGIAAPDGTQDLGTTYSAWLPKLGVSYRLAPLWTAGISAQRGYRTGGVNYSYSRGASAYAPEFTNNYDLSLKGDLGERLLLSLSAYRIDWRAQQVDASTNSLDTYTVNAGRSRLYGVEMELRGQATPEIEVFTALGVSQTRFLQFTAPAGDFSGNQFAQSPRRTLSLGATWTHGPLQTNADVQYEGPTYSDAANTPSLTNASHTLVNGKISYAVTRAVRLFASGQNLLDKFYTVYTYANVANRQIDKLGRARSARVGLEAEF